MADRSLDESQILAAVSRVLRGDTGAFEVVVRRYSPLVYRLARSYLGSPEDAEDATQEVFVKVLAGLASFRLDRRFLPWLYSVTLNHLRSRQRRISGFRARLATRDPEELEAPAGHDAAEEEVKERVRAAVRSLPARLREVTALYYLEGLDTAEVAEALGIGVENVKSRLHRARAKLRVSLAEERPDGAGAT